MFPLRSGEWIPKTLIYAKDDSHADLIVDKVRDIFGEGNDFCKKITYRAGSKKTAEDLIAEFRTSPQFRVAVTVDMIATGTDIKPLEIVLFLRDVRSATYYEQMKGRGTRTIDPARAAHRHADARAKTHFVSGGRRGCHRERQVELPLIERAPTFPSRNSSTKSRVAIAPMQVLSSLASRLLRLDAFSNPRTAAASARKCGRDTR